MNATILQTSFEKTQCVDASFTDVKMSESTFLQANAKRAVFRYAQLINVDFNQSNLHAADFINGKIINSSLANALSIHNIQFSDGMDQLYRNWTTVNQTDCNSTLFTSWHLHSGTVATVSNGVVCRFFLLSCDIGATMSQRVNIAHAWHSARWPRSKDFANMCFGQGVSVVINEINDIGKVQFQRNIST